MALPSTWVHIWATSPHGDAVLTHPHAAWRGQLWTASAYVGAVVAVNVGFSRSPDLDWLWSLLVGGVLVLRDAAQRHWGHGVLGLMLLAAGVSYRVGNPAVALASATAFLIGETVDWVVFTTTHRPFADRVWRSVLASAPVDTAVFLHLAQIWSWPLFSVGVFSKVAVGGAIALALRRGAHPTPPLLS
jgi:hypothetical protein